MARTPPIPLAGAEYDESNETASRRIIEQELEDIRNELLRIETHTTKQGTLALRRHQFLLMGQ